MDAMQIFWLIALVATGLFVIQFVLTVFFGDVDTDADVDVDADTGSDISSMVSFKGLVHFGIGFGWTMVLAGDASATSVAVGVIVGLVFVVVLWRLYILAYRLQCVRVREKPQSIVGREGRIYNNRGKGLYTIQIGMDGSLRELDVVSLSECPDYATGEHVAIEKYASGKYYIK